MAAQEDLVLDLFHGEYHGAWTGSEKTDRGKKPKIRKVATNLVTAVFPFLQRPKTFPYALGNKNIREVSVPDAPDLKILIPTDDLNLDLETTIWHQIQQGEESRINELLEENQRLKKERGKLKKKVSKLEDEEEEKKKRQSAEKSNQVQTHECIYCGHEMPESKWNSEDGVCPECGTVNEDYE